MQAISVEMVWQISRVQRQRGVIDHQQMGCLFMGTGVNHSPDSGGSLSMARI